MRSLCLPHHVCLRAADAEQKHRDLQRVERMHRRALTVSRWRWALELVTTGQVLCAAPRSQRALSADADPNDAAEADDVGRSAEGEEQGEEQGEEEVEDPARPPRRIGGRFRWLWLYRGAYMHARQEDLDEAEASLAAAEAAVKAPLLTPVGPGRYRNSTDKEIAVLTQPTQLITDVRTQEDRDSNKRLTCGRLRPGAVVSVVSQTALDETDEREGSTYLRVAADEANGIPAG